MPNDVRVYRHYGLDASLWVVIAPFWVDICVPEDVRVYRHYGFDAPLWVEIFLSEVVRAEYYPLPFDRY